MSNKHQTQPVEVPVTSDSLRRLQLALEAQIVAAGAGGVQSFNGRTGHVVLSSGDVTGALGYTPGGGGSTLEIDGGDANSAAPAYIAIDGGSA